jgi:NitT/TauT family transport system substrate-binding protein
VKRGSTGVATHRAVALGALTGLLLLGIGCSNGSSDDARSDGADSPRAPSGDGVVVGYEPVLTHVPALVGIEMGLYAEFLPADVRLETKAINSRAAVDSLLAGTLDAAYLNSRDAIDAYSRSGRNGIRIVAGATSGGAALVVRPDISTVGELRGASLGVFDLASAQAVALQAFLLDNGLRADAGEGGDVSIVPHAGEELVEAIRAGALTGAWVVEPWVSRLVLEGGKVLADERALWPDGQFATTALVVRTGFLEAQRALVGRLLDGHVRAVTEAAENPVEAQRAANAVIRAQNGSAIADEVIAMAWDNLTFTNDPIASSLQKSADDASRVGAAKPVDLSGAYDLTLLNEVLARLGMDQVSS